MASVIASGRLQAFLNYDTLLGFRNLKDHLFTLGVLAFICRDSRGEASRVAADKKV